MSTTPQSSNEHYTGIELSLNDLLHLKSKAVTNVLSSKRSAKSWMSGQHQSRRFGRGMTFSEVREYVAGDDARDIDWRVTARLAKPHTKVYEEERERPVILCIDQRQSMYFGTQQALKSYRAVEAAAMLAWGAFSMKDRLGGLVFNDSTYKALKPTGGKRGVQRFFHELLDFHKKLNTRPFATPPSANSFSAALSQLPTIIQPGSLVILISDFLGIEGIEHSTWASLRRHANVLGVLMHDPLEHTLPEDLLHFNIGGQAVSVDTKDPDIRDHQRQLFSEHFESTRKTLLTHGRGFLAIGTNDRPFDVLQRGIHPRTPIPTA